MYFRQGRNLPIVSSHPTNTTSVTVEVAERTATKGKSINNISGMIRAVNI